METESFERLTRLKPIVGQMSISNKVAFIAEIKIHLSSEMLKTSDGTHTFTEENILSVALGALIVNDRREFERITGFYVVVINRRFVAACTTAKEISPFPYGAKKCGGFTV